jgi:hypothetical protein
VAPGALDQAGIRGAEFRPERVRIETRQRITLRGLFEMVGVSTRSGEEEVRAPVFLDSVIALAARAGGQPPMPAPPDIRTVEDLKRLTGAEQLSAILERKDQLEASIDAWTEVADRAEARRAQWDLATALRNHAEGLPVASDVSGELDAVRAQRSLLDGTDHVAPLVAKLAATLRAELTAAHAALAESVAAARAMLDADATWRLVPEGNREPFLREEGLESPAQLQIGSNEALLRTLDARPLSSWRDLKDAIPQRIARALERAAAVTRRGDPLGRSATTITIRRGTLTDEAAVRAWLEEHEQRLTEAVKTGPVIVG